MRILAKIKGVEFEFFHHDITKLKDCYSIYSYSIDSKNTSYIIESIFNFDGELKDCQLIRYDLDEEEGEWNSIGWRAIEDYTHKNEAQEIYKQLKLLGKEVKKC